MRQSNIKVFWQCGLIITSLLIGMALACVSQKSMIDSIDGDAVSRSIRP